MTKVFSVGYEYPETGPQGQSGAVHGVFLVEAESPEKAEAFATARIQSETGLIEHDISLDTYETERREGDVPVLKA